MALSPAASTERIGRQSKVCREQLGQEDWCDSYGVGPGRNRCTGSKAGHGDASKEPRRRGNT